MPDIVRGNPAPTTAAFSVERVRAQMLAEVQLPTDFLQKAIDKAYSKLEAKKTHIVQWQGKITDTLDVDDNQAQLLAADKIFNIGGLYARERESAPPTPTIAMEIDAQTGVVRLVVGAAIPHAGDAIRQLPAAGTSVPNLPTQEELPYDNLITLGRATTQETSIDRASVPHGEPDPPDAGPQVVKVRRGRMPEAVWDALFGDDPKVNDGHH